MNLFSAVPMVMPVFSNPHVSRGECTGLCGWFGIGLFAVMIGMLIVMYVMVHRK